MPEVVEPLTLPDTGLREDSSSLEELDRGYVVICWDDPVNFMDYVTHVFQRVFGWDRVKAERHMKEVHDQGKSLLVRDTLEKAEFYVHQLQQFHLHATLEREE